MNLLDTDYGKTEAIACICAAESPLTLAILAEAAIAVLMAAAPLVTMLVDVSM